MTTNPSSKSLPFLVPLRLTMMMMMGKGKMVGKMMVVAMAMVVGAPLANGQLPAGRGGRGGHRPELEVRRVDTGRVQCARAASG